MWGNMGATPTVLVASPEQRLLRDARVNDRAGDGRDPFRRSAQLDLERILSAHCWYRLGGVTQVLSPDEGAEQSFLEPDSLVSTRMTHSLGVARVARAIAIRLLSYEGNGHKERHRRIASFGGLDADVAAVAGLAHDLGHPPFGHAAEAALDKLAREEFGLRDGFEGNAQTLRIITKLEAVADYCGLDLTRATVAAVIKYPWLRRGDGKHWRKFNAYDTEMAVLQDSRLFLPDGYPPERQTLEASIMDIADDISYAFQDLEDFHLAGLITRRRIDNLIKPRSAFMRSLEARLKAGYPDFPFEARFGQARQSAEGILMAITRRNLARPELIGNIKHAGATQIAEFIRDVDFPVNHPDEPYWDGGPLLGLDVEKWGVIQILKAIAKKDVIDADIVRDGGARGASYVTFLARELRKIVDGESQGVPPIRLKRMLDDTRHGDASANEQRRRIIDYICTLTDGQARRLCEKYGYSAERENVRAIDGGRVSRG
jgi:dGTPase